MDFSYNLPREARLSNSLLKSRPVRVNRTRMKSKERDLSAADQLDSRDSAARDPSPDDAASEFASAKTHSDAPRVVFRRKSVSSSNRRDPVVYPSPEDVEKRPSMPLNPFGSTLFYVTSRKSETTSNSSCSSNPATSSPFESNDTRISKRNSATSYQSLPREQPNDRYSTQTVTNESPVTTALMDDLSIESDVASRLSDQSMAQLNFIQENPNNCRCADCDAERPTVAIVSWLLVICQQCADVHHRLTSDFLQLQPLIEIASDVDLVDLFHYYGNQYANSLLENEQAAQFKPNENSSRQERDDYIRRKYRIKCYAQFSTPNLTQNQLNQMLYENVETSDYKTTLRLIMQGADANYSEKMFSVADHAQRYQQIKQMKLILANGGVSELQLVRTNPTDVNEAPAYLASRHGVLKGFLTRYENERLKIYSSSSDSTKPPRYLSEIDLNRVLAFCNQSVNAVSLRCRLNNSPSVQKNSQCTVIVDEAASSNEYIWVFPNELERSLWIREFLQRQYSFHQLIYPNFLLFTQMNFQEGINADKQQVIAIVYPGRFVLCSETMFDEVDLRKYSSLTYQKTNEFYGVLLCLVNRRFLYLSSPVTKLTDYLYSSLHQATRVNTLTDLNGQILTSQGIPVIVERFINFIFEHGLLTRGIYRQAGLESKIKQLLSECLDDPFTTSLNHDTYTEHDVASALKRFLRQLETPLLGTRQNYQAWLRSTVDKTMTGDYLIPYYRALLRDLKQNFPTHYATLRTMLMHLHTVAMLAETNGMTMSNLVSTFAPCLISQTTPTSIEWNNVINGRERKMSVDEIDIQSARQLLENESIDRPGSPSVTKLKRNQSFNSSRQSLHTTQSDAASFSSSYAHVTPSIEADLQIMANLCRYFRDLFDVSDEELAHERTCVETLIFIRDNPSCTRQLDGRLISVYFESRADEFNGYAMNVFEQETTADMIIERLLRQVDQQDCFFWALFEVIIDQNLERPMYSCESISEVLDRYGKYLSHELNRQATFVVKLNYLQFEKERLQQRMSAPEHQSVQCEYYDEVNQRWTTCVWLFERALLQIHRLIIHTTDRALRARPSTTSQPQQPTSTVVFDEHTLLYAWGVEDIYMYIGADCRLVHPFDMNDYRVLTILPPQPKVSTNAELPFGVSFRFADRQQMFSWYLELVHINGHDKWTRDGSRTIPDGANYLPLQNYHAAAALSARKKSDQFKNKFLAKSCHVASNLYKQLRK